MATECERTFAFGITDNATAAYIDLGQCLSMVNRRLYRQGKCYYIQKLQWLSASNLSAGKTVSKVTLTTIPYNWVSRNAWVKAKALWNRMNQKVLKDNPSVEGKWADFKVYFNGAHFTGGSNAAGPTLNLKPIDGNFDAVLDGEWNMSTFVLPQHDVDPTSGEVLAADEFQGHMLGANLGSAGAWTSVGLIQGYADTRARVQATPDVPSDMSESWMTQLSDDGSQEPELADNIEAQNDLPPYDPEDYPGGTANMDGGVIQTQMVCTVTNQIEKDIGFPVPLGLLKVERALIDDDTGGVLFITLAPGNYHGVLATEMKQ